MGRSVYPEAKEVLITADSRGSNGSRTSCGKICLEHLASEIGLKIAVCHFPPGTSKWKKDASVKAHLASAIGVAPDPGGIGYNTHFAGSDIHDGPDNSGYVALNSSISDVIADLVVTLSPQYATNPTGDLFDLGLELSGTSFGDGSGGSSTMLSPSDGVILAQLLLTSSQQPTNPVP